MGNGPVGLAPTDGTVNARQDHVTRNSQAVPLTPIQPASYQTGSGKSTLLGNSYYSEVDELHLDILRVYKGCYHMKTLQV